MSLIKEFKDKCDKAFDEYFESMSIDENMSIGEIKQKLEENKHRKLPDFVQDEKDFLRTLKYAQWKNEICENVKYFADSLFLLKEDGGTEMTDSELSDLAIYAFEEYNVLNSDLISLMSNEYINNNAEIRNEIINGDSCDLIANLNFLSEQEKVNALCNSPHFAINRVIELTDNEKDKQKYINVYICLGGDFNRITEWKQYITVELISLIISVSKFTEDFIYEHLNTHSEFKLTHIYELIKRNPQSVHIIPLVEDEFSKIYVKTSTNPENEFELLKESYEYIKNEIDDGYSVLFKNAKNREPIVSLEDYCKSYKEIYI